MEKTPVTIITLPQPMATLVCCGAIRQLADSEARLGHGPLLIYADDTPFTPFDPNAQQTLDHLTSIQQDYIVAMTLGMLDQLPADYAWPTGALIGLVQVVDIDKRSSQVRQDTIVVGGKEQPAPQQQLLQHEARAVTLDSCRLLLHPMTDVTPHETVTTIQVDLDAIVRDCVAMSCIHPQVYGNHLFLPVCEELFRDEEFHQRRIKEHHILDLPQSRILLDAFFPDRGPCLFDADGYSLPRCGIYPPHEGKTFDGVTLICGDQRLHYNHVESFGYEIDSWTCHHRDNDCWYDDTWGPIIYHSYIINLNGIIDFRYQEGYSYLN